MQTKKSIHRVLLSQGHRQRGLRVSVNPPPPPHPFLGDEVIIIKQISYLVKTQSPFLDL